MYTCKRKFYIHYIVVHTETKRCVHFFGNIKIIQNNFQTKIIFGEEIDHFVFDDQCY